MGKYRDMKNMMKMLTDPEAMIEMGVQNIRSMLDTFDKDKTIGSITDDEIRKYVKKQIDEARP